MACDITAKSSAHDWCWKLNLINNYNDAPTAPKEKLRVMDHHMEMSVSRNTQGLTLTRGTTSRSCNRFSSMFNRANTSSKSDIFTYSFMSSKSRSKVCVVTLIVLGPSDGVGHIVSQQLLKKLLTEAVATAQLRVENMSSSTRLSSTWWPKSLTSSMTKPVMAAHRLGHPLNWKPW